MQDGADFTLEFTLQQQIQKIVLVQIMGNFTVHQIAELVARSEIVYRNDVGNATRIERLDDIGTNKAGSAGNHDGHDSSFFCLQPAGITPAIRLHDAV